jgi:hypothetical protein
MRAGCLGAAACGPNPVRPLYSGRAAAPKMRTSVSEAVALARQLSPLRRLTGSPGDRTNPNTTLTIGGLVASPGGQRLVSLGVERRDWPGVGRNNTSHERLVGVTLRCGFCEEPGLGR